MFGTRPIRSPRGSDFPAVFSVAGAAREREAADRIFGLLPPDQADEFRDLWDEFEARATPAAQFAAALDRLQPILHNYRTQGRLWREHGITAAQVIAHNRHMAEGAPLVWEYAHSLIREAARRLREARKLRPESEPEWEILYELFRSTAGQFACAECGTTGLAVGPALKDEADWLGP